jgi:hypothetical protein
MALTATVRATKPTVGADANLWGGEQNAAFDYFDAAINGGINVPIPDANVVLVADGTVNDQARYALIAFTGALTADRRVTYPANAYRGWAVNNTTGGHRVIVANPTGPTISLPPGAIVQLSSSGAGFSFLAPATVAPIGSAHLQNSMLEQWGTGTTNASGIANVTFPSQFPTAVYTVLVTMFGFAGPVAWSIVLNNPTVTGFQAYAANAAGGGVVTNFYWMARGS